MKNQIQYLLENPKLVEEKRKMAIERIEQNYTWDKIASDYEVLFLKMAKAEKRRAKVTSTEQVCEEV